MFSSLVQQMICSFDRIKSYLLHSWQYVVVKTYHSIDICFFRQFGNIFLQLLVRDLISRFILTIRITIFLYRIIGEMHIKISIIFERIWERRSAHITLFIPIPSENARKACNQHVMTNIELPVVVKKRFLHIFL